ECHQKFDPIFFFQAEDGIRDFHVTGVQTCALPISSGRGDTGQAHRRDPAAGRTRHARQAAGRQTKLSAESGEGACALASGTGTRSEERRVGKERRWKRSRDKERKAMSYQWHSSWCM